MCVCAYKSYIVGVVEQYNTMMAFIPSALWEYKIDVVGVIEQKGTPTM